MDGGSSVALSRDIKNLFGSGTATGLTDRQLLERFIHRRDPAAFEMIVVRHGPMVLRVCRTLLHDPHDAHDAFQATFLILVRRSGSIRRLDSVGSWLYGVACRAAARVRVGSARRRAVEERAAARVMEAVQPAEAEEGDRDELRPVVQEEVLRLPEKYRAAVVLCYWEGLTQEQAAARLGCPLGTVRSRLARAKDLLRRRLVRRGLAPLVGLPSSVLDLPSAAASPATVPYSWVAATVGAASQVAACAGPAPASVSIVVQDVLRKGFMMKLKTTAICLSLMGLGTAGVILAAARAERDQTPSAASHGRGLDEGHGPRTAPTAHPATERARPPRQPQKDYVIEPPDLLRVEVLEALPGRPISGERLVRPDGRITLGFYGEVYVAGLTVPEVKEKIVLHLRKYLSDEVLGLLERDPATGDYKRDQASQLVRKQPRETVRVIVDVAAINSKHFYILGEVLHPGKVPITGNETVLDALQFAGGLLPTAAPEEIRLVRPAPPGTCCEQILAIRLAAITDGGDPTTNYQLMPGDRIIVHARSQAGPDGSVHKAAASRLQSVESRVSRQSAPTVRDEPADDGVPRRGDGAENSPALRDVGRRLGEVERKLDRVLEALERRP